MKFHPYVQRGLMALVVLLLSVSVARLLVTMHQQDERISILENQVETLLADTSRLQISGSPRTYYNTDYTRGNTKYHSSHTRIYNRYNEGSSFQESIPQDSSPASLQEASTTDTPRKFTESHLFDLNTIDSLTLIRIPGIAARTASVILKQRQIYGGFYDANQLRDFMTWDAAKDYLDDWCTRWFSVNAERIVKLPVNTATISQLQHHPYLSHEQAVEISQYRARHKGFRQASELQMLSSFSAEDITRILPYLSFE